MKKIILALLLFSINLFNTSYAIEEVELEQTQEKTLREFIQELLHTKFTKESLIKKDKEVVITAVSESSSIYALQFASDDLKKDKEVTAIIQTCEKQIDVLAYTEHSTRHSSIVSSWTAQILRETDADENLVNLGEIAGYLHDIGNLVNRIEHSQSGAIMAFRILDNLGFSAKDTATVTNIRLISKRMNTLIFFLFCITIKCEKQKVCFFQ